MERARRGRLANATFAVATSAFVLQGLWVLPSDTNDLCYVLALENDGSALQDWVHPLWLPFLGAYRAVLAVFGWHGRMLIPIEVLNIGFAAATLAVGYRLCRRVAVDPMAGAVGVLFLMSIDGFWDGALRTTPYAPAFLCVVGCAALLISDAAISVSRYAMAGVLAGLATGLHASAMALLPVAAVAVVVERWDVGSRVTPRLAAFAAAMVGTVALCWLAFMRYHPDFLTHALHPMDLLLVAEQVPGSSLYTSHSWLTQFTLLSSGIGISAIPFVGAGIFAILPVRHRLLHFEDIRRTRVEKRLVCVAAAVFVAFGGFFLINNAVNGFIFSALALLPVLLAVIAGRGPAALRRLALIGVPFALVQGAANTWGRAAGGGSGLIDELRFVERLAGPSGILLTPGCPYPETPYLSALPIFRVAVEGASEPCAAPSLEAGEPAAARIREWIGRGRTVYFAQGNLDDDFSTMMDLGGEKETQLFFSPQPQPKARADHVAALRSALERTGLRFGAPVFSPVTPGFSRSHGSYVPVLLADTPAGR